MPPSLTCCTVGTLRPRLFFVRFGTGTGGASLLPPPSDDPGDVDGECPCGRCSSASCLRLLVRGDWTYSSSSSP